MYHDAVFASGAYKLATKIARYREDFYMNLVLHCRQLDLKKVYLRGSCVTKSAIHFPSQI